MSDSARAGSSPAFFSLRRVALRLDVKELRPTCVLLPLGSTTTKKDALLLAGGVGLGLLLAANVDFFQSNLDFAARFVADLARQPQNFARQNQRAWGFLGRPVRTRSR